MAWVQGSTSIAAVEGSWTNRGARRAAEKFRGLVQDIEKAKFATATCSNGNIMVSGKTAPHRIYDGMWVPR